MKTQLLFALAITATVLGATSCKKKEPTLREEVSDKVADALNTRPHEKWRDAAEDLEKDAKAAGKDVKDAVEQAGKEIKKDIHEATE